MLTLTIQTLKKTKERNIFISNTAVRDTFQGFISEPHMCGTKSWFWCHSSLTPEEDAAKPFSEFDFPGIWGHIAMWSLFVMNIFVHYKPLLSHTFHTNINVTGRAHFYCGTTESHIISKKQTVWNENGKNTLRCMWPIEILFGLFISHE